MKLGNLSVLFNQLKLENEVSVNDFKKTFVHISVYEGKKNSKNPGNSRYVFLGMYAFKGILAKIVSKYIAGNGKQLQQYLGNIYSNENLARLYDMLKLNEVAQTHENLNKDNIKHIFALGYLGFVFENCTMAYTEQIANTYFLQKSEHYLPKVLVVNPIQILKAKAEVILNQKIKIINFEENKLNCFQILLISGEVIGEHSSISATYAKKKAIKIATKYVLDREAQQPEYQAMVERQNLLKNEKIAREKALKQKEHEQNLATKKEKRLAIKEEVRKEAFERDIRRVLNKKNSKNKNGNKTEKDFIKEALKDPNLNPSKRRFLEDKLK